jgi:hypothetical protein
MVTAALIGLAVPAAVATTGAAPATARPVARTTSTTTIAPGLTLTKINTADPMQIRVLTIDPSKPVTVDVATAGSTFGSYARPSTIGANHNALAAINGDFTLDGRPVHAFAEDGFVRGSGLQGGGAFAISKDETDLYIGSPSLSMSGRDVSRSSSAFAVTAMNSGPPGPGEVVGFTAAGGSIEKPPDTSCSARLLSSSKLHWNAGQLGLYKDWKVDTVRCQATPLALGAGMVLAARQAGNGADAIKAMRAGDTVRLAWSPGWSGVMDMVGGMPVLVSDGTVVAKNDCHTYFCERNPRTAIGITAEGKILFVVVDGRATGLSIGMTLQGLAREMVSLGATWAVNLDGGGGSAMWVKGSGIVTRPSDGSERPVTNALVVLPGGDTGEPVPVSAAPVGRTLAADAEAAAASDPGSTGGLIQALVAGDLGHTPRLPSAWVRAARTFRLAQG